MLMRDTNIKIDRDRCVGCGRCVDRCIMDNLRLSVAPCRQACPLNLNCQGYVRLIANGREQEALAVMNDVLPFVGMLSRLCQAPCEKACARGRVDRPVPIRALKGYLADHHPVDPAEITRRSTAGSHRRVAVTGSGPAGLMAAWTLWNLGYQVTVFEKESRISPELDICGYASDFPASEKDVMYQILVATGMVFNLAAGLGQDLTLETLETSFDAIVVPKAEHSNPDRCPPEGWTKGLPEGWIEADHKSVFFAGELSRAAGSVVTALSSGREAALSAQGFLSGKPPRWGRVFWKADGNIRDCRPPYERARHVNEAEAGSTGPLSTEAARFQAERCLSCGRPFDVNETCWYCLPCEIECPHQALEVRIPYLVR